MSAPRDLVNRWVAAALRWGSYVSAALLLVGVVWILLEGNGDRPIQVGPPMPPATLMEQLLRGSPYAVMQAGVLLLLFTPLLRLGVAAASFWMEGERRYTLVSLVVLTMILLSLLLARGG